MLRVNSGQLAALKTAVREAGLRATRSRVLVLSLLRGASKPLSHADAFAELASSGFDRATVYRNLTDLADAGLLTRTDLGDHVWRFEVVKDNHDTAKHPHFVCASCGAVACLPEEAVTLNAVRGHRALKRKGISVQVRGLCDTCA
jgi:Fur family ferric uptake transcriptional regulator